MLSFISVKKPAPRRSENKKILVKFNEFDVELNFKKGIKSFRLKVAKDAKISLSLPFYATQKSAFEFLAKHADWLSKTHAKMLANLPKEDEFRLLGKIYRIKIDANLKGVNLVEFEGSGELLEHSGAGKFKDKFITSNKSEILGKFDSGNSENLNVCEPNFTSEFNNEDKICGAGKFQMLNSDNTAAKFESNLQTAGKFNGSGKLDGKREREGRKFDGEICAPNLKAIEAYKKAVARQIFSEFTDKFMPAVNRKIARLTIRKMQTRWGSCNHKKGYINLSLNLIEKPPKLVEYVVLHEMTHLIFPHHQKSFYDFIANLMSDFREREKELNKK